MDKCGLIDTEECANCETCRELYMNGFEYIAADRVAVVFEAKDGDDTSYDAAIEPCPAGCIHH
jgi:ferredoxin